MKNGKVFVLGLDGASFRVLDPLVRNGMMPNLGSITEQGARAVLRSSMPPITPAAWVSFMTGKNPGKHGVYGWLQQIRGEYECNPIDIRNFYNDTLWGYLGSHGKKVGVINVPITYPPLEVNGFMISGMDTPFEENCSYPEGLYKELLSKIGDYRVEIKWRHYNDKSKAEFLDDLIYCTKKRLEATLHLMERFEWDFFMSVFISMDRVQHFLWKQIENIISGNTDGEIEKKILNYYRFMDEVIGEIRGRLDSDTSLIIMSDHGFKPCSKSVEWNRWLIENNYLCIKKNRKKYLDSIIPLLHSLGVNREKIRSLFKSLKLDKHTTMHKISSFSRDIGIIDWEKTKAVFLQPYGLRINLKGREPEGIINSGDEYRGLVSELKGKMMALKDHESGICPVKNIYAAEEIYKGPYVDLAPDLIIDYGNNPYDAFSVKLESPEIFMHTTDERKGSHEMEGIFIGHGEAFEKIKADLPIEMVDIFPTILHIMGLPVPSDADGRVIEDMIHNSFKEKPVEKTSVCKDGDDTVSHRYRSSDEDMIIKEQLKGLGYID
ncbi:MAG: hypothetical protein C4560_08170 [Nitrospiraceae bacterium]|nr:MAG: hypothetical protein C4560_08170 [Nitrospiraceae bacterium]